MSQLSGPNCRVEGFGVQTRGLGSAAFATFGAWVGRSSHRAHKCHISDSGWSAWEKFRPQGLDPTIKETSWRSWVSQSFGHA